MGNAKSSRKNEKPRLFGHQCRLTWNDILMNLAAIGIGVVLAVWPQIAEELVMTVIGAAGVVIGLSFVIRYALMDIVDAIDSNTLVTGLIWIAGGILVIVLRKVLVALLPVILGMFILFCGLTKLHLTLNLKRMSASRWYLELANACFSIIMGTLIICQPIAAAFVFMRLVGIVFAVEGILDFVSKFIYVGVHDNYMRIYASSSYYREPARPQPAAPEEPPKTADTPDPKFESDKPEA